MLNLMWFRSDLRVYDNPALNAAMNQGDTVAVYCITERQWDVHGDAPIKRALIRLQLGSLAKSLSNINVPLVVLSVGDFEGLVSQLTTWCIGNKVNSVFFNDVPGVNELSCAEHLVENLERAGIASHKFYDQYMIPPGQVVTQTGEMFKVYTAFKRQFIRHYELNARPLVKLPQPQSELHIETDLSISDLDSTDMASAWPEGEDEAHDRLNRFLEQRVYAYADKRDFPAEEGTSVISPYLAIGVLSVSQCMRAALSLNHGQFDGGNAGLATWINELIWREFYRHLFHFYPRLSMNRAFKEDTDRLPWSHDLGVLRLWQEGRTGYPIVDAGMRQLKQTGWMHNRLRMICAMFLTKHLFIDWRLGERHFMEHLVDGDLPSNNGGWQWSASTGTDAAPYFRIFNPTRQSERFDPNGDFIRKYVPELSTLDARSIHFPNGKQRQVVNYDMPIVDHQTAVAKTKSLFKALSMNGQSIDSPSVAQSDMFNANEHDRLLSQQVDN